MEPPFCGIIKVSPTKNVLVFADKTQSTKVSVLENLIRNCESIYVHVVEALIREIKIAKSLMKDNSRKFLVPKTL